MESKIKTQEPLNIKAKSAQNSFYHKMDLSQIKKPTFHTSPQLVSAKQISRYYNLATVHAL